MLNNKRKMVILGVIVAILIFCAQSIFAVKYEKKLTAVFNDIKVYINGYEAQLEDSNGKKIEPFTIDGTVYLPVRTISELLGVAVTWDKDTNSIYLDHIEEDYYEADYESFTRIFEIAEANSMVGFTRIGSTQRNYTEIIFDYLPDFSEDGEPWVRIGANAIALKGTKKDKNDIGIFSDFYAKVIGDQVTYEYYAKPPTGREKEADGYLIFTLQPNGNIRVDEYGNLGFPKGITLKGEYEFSGLG